MTLSDFIEGYINKLFVFVFVFVSPLHVWVKSFLGALTGVSGLAATDAPKFSYLLSQSLLEGIEFLTEGVECHYNTIIFI